MYIIKKIRNFTIECKWIKSHRIINYSSPEILGNYYAHKWANMAVKKRMNNNFINNILGKRIIVIDNSNNVYQDQIDKNILKINKKNTERNLETNFPYLNISKRIISHFSKEINSKLFIEEGLELINISNIIEKVGKESAIKAFTGILNNLVLKEIHNNAQMSYILLMKLKLNPIIMKI